MSFLSAYTSKNGSSFCSSPINKIIIPELPSVRRLYIGDSNAASNKDLLQNYGITHIVNCAQELPNYFEDSFRYLHLDMTDSYEAIDHNLERSLAYIRTVFETVPDARILVHCHMGMSRSASVVINYLITRKPSHQRKLTYDDILERMRRCRPIVAPNKSYEQQLRKKTAAPGRG